MGDASEAARPGAAASSRYRVEGEIARGGMGIVWRARDQVRDAWVALKRPLADAQAGALPRHAALLEREYRTLAAIKHPRVISVYDYGIDAQGPYYTMELLDGEDLKSKSPLPWREVCGYLRDVASSLALLHARNLLHRDVSPSNIRITSDGRAKLLDFGALVPFGRHDVVAGTPAGVAPEALDGLDLDQRLDLYALGAAAYHALTGRPAYPARALTQLRALWSRGKPQAPSLLVEGVPPALDELVLSLLSLDPLSRPASAAEVIDRLSAIADLPSEDDQAVVLSYVRNPVLVGRDEARTRALARLTRMLSGRGGTLLVEGAVGHGKTVFLRELEREARLHGARVLSVNARAHQAPYASVRALLAQARYELGEGVSSLDAALGSDSSGQFAPAREPESSAQESEERFAQQFIKLCALSPLVLAVDDANHADVDSAAVLTRLTELANDHPLWIIVSADADSENEQVALRVLRRSAVRVHLTPLVAAEVERLVRSIFGDVPGLRRVAAWLVEQTSGSPMLCTELLAELVTRRTIRYEGATWILPQELQREVATTTQAVLERRLSRLSERARELASCMSARRTSLSVRLCQRVAQEELALSEAELNDALEELVAQKVLVGDGRHFAFTQGHLREVLYARLPLERRARVHRHIAEHLARDLSDDPCRWLEVGCHFSFSGDEKHAAKYLRPAISALTRRSEALIRAVPDLVALHAHYQRTGVDRGEALRASMPLVIAGLYVEPEVQDRIGEQTLELLEQRSGLSLASRLSAKLGANLSVFIGLVYGYLRYLFSSRLYRFNTFSYPLAYFGAAASMDATAAFRLDRRMQSGLSRRLTFLKALGLRHPARLVYEIVCMGPLYVQGRFSEALSRLVARLAELPNVRFLDENTRAQFETAMRFWVGRVKLLTLSNEPLAQADRVAASPSHHDRILAEFLRFAHHLGRGETASAEPYRERLDALAARYGGSWVVDLLSACEFVPYHHSADVVGLKRCVQQLQALVATHPSFELHLAVARAMYEGHRGREGRALELYAELGESVPAFSDPIWSYAEAHRAECLNAVGAHPQALERAERALAQVGAGLHEFPLAFQQLEREAAVALAMLGRHDEAAARLDALLERFGDADHPLLIGLLHRDRARVAAAARDRDAFFLHLDEARVRFRTTRNPALMARLRKLGELGKRFGLDAAAEAGTGGELSDDMELVFPAASSRSDMSVRGQRVLEHVVSLVGAARARLYVLRHGAPVLSAQHGEDRWEASLASDVEELVRSFLQEDERTAERTGQLLARSDASASTHTLLPLIAIEEGQTLVVGALVLAEAVRLHELSFERLERLASALHESERASPLPQPTP